jgi:hypothetical protein
MALAVSASPSRRRDALAISADADVLGLLRAVVAEQAQQRVMLAAILAALERNRGPRDQADAALLLAIAAAIDDRPFTSSQLMAHAAVDLALAAALADADIDHAQELGCVCRRLEGIAVKGLRLERVGASRSGIVWKVQVCEA